jgi:hypothetical protein
MAQAKIIYKPQGGSKREWVVDLENPPWDVAFNTEKTTGWPWQVFAERLSQSSHIALQALIFTLRKRDEARLEIGAVTPSLAECDFELIDSEPEPESGEA